MESKIKQYVLLEATNPSAPIFQNVNGNRIRINRLPQWRPYLQYTFMENQPDGGSKNVTTRLKLNSNSIYQDVQVKDENIPANDKFTDIERNVTKFTNGVLIVKNPVVQKFLEEGCAHFEGFKGQTEYLTQPMFKIYDREAEVKSTNNLFKKTLQAATKISEMEEEEASSLLIKIFGVGYVPPTDIEEMQNILVTYMDGSEEHVDEILSEIVSDQEKALILIGKLVNEEVISFDAVKDTVARKKGEDWIALTEIPSNHQTDMRYELFAEFLVNKKQKALYKSLEALV